MDESEQKVRDRLAREMYLAYCKRSGLTPYRTGYVPAWALDYADTAVDFLGIPEDMLSDVVSA